MDLAVRTVLLYGLAGIGMTSCGTKPSLRPERQKNCYPRITARVPGDFDDSAINFAVRTRNYQHDRPHTSFVFEPVPIERLPKETVRFTKWLISRDFFSDLENRADRFWGVTIGNYADQAGFNLLLTEEFDEFDSPTGAWIYFLCVHQKPDGKLIEIATLVVSGQGTILERREYNW